MTHSELKQQLVRAVWALKTEHGDVLYGEDEFADMLANILLQLVAVTPKHYHHRPPTPPQS
jgi:hypothetical protein